MGRGTVGGGGTGGAEGGGGGEGKEGGGSESPGYGLGRVHSFSPFWRPTEAWANALPSLTPQEQGGGGGSPSRFLPVGGQGDSEGQAFVQMGG